MKKPVDSNSIIWTEGGLEELRRQLAGEAVEELIDDSEQFSDLSFPWPLTIIRQEVVSGEDGTILINVVVGYDDVEGADDYEVRVSLLDNGGEDFLPPLDEWTFGTGSEHSINGPNDVQYTTSTAHLVAAASAPDTFGDWQTISIEVTIDQSAISADGYFIGLADANIYPATYIGNDGSTIGFFTSGITSGNLNTASGAWCGFYESVFTGTGNGGPTIAWHDGISRNQIALARGAWNMVGEHKIKVVWTRQSENLARCVVTHDGVESLSASSVFVPSNSRIFITAATGDSFNDHRIADLVGSVTY